MMEEVYLTSSQKSALQNERQLYVLLRMIHFIEMYYAYDRIKKNVYEEEMTKLLDKYKRFSQIVPNFNIEDFCRRFAIPENQISWAKRVIANGINKVFSWFMRCLQEQQQKDASLFIRATSTFIECIDTLGANEDNPTVGSLKSCLESLLLILDKVASRLNSYDFNDKFKSYQSMQSFLIQLFFRFTNYVASKSFNQTLTSSQFQDIKITVDGLYRMMGHLSTK